MNEFYLISFIYLQVLSISAPYVRENPISRSQILATHEYSEGFGYMTMVCEEKKEEESMHKRLFIFTLVVCRLLVMPFIKYVVLLTVQ